MLFFVNNEKVNTDAASHRLPRFKFENNAFGLAKILSNYDTKHTQNCIHATQGISFEKNIVLIGREAINNQDNIRSYCIDSSVYLDPQ